MSVLRTLTDGSLMLSCVVVAGCGGARATPGVQPKVIVEDGSLLIVDELSSESVPLKIRFAVDSDVIEDESHRPLDVLAEYLVDNAELELIEVHGHTDEQGTPEYNLDLSQRRAESVVRYLVSRGVHESRLQARGFGARRPAMRGHTVSAWQRNRRVEFLIAEPQ